METLHNSCDKQAFMMRSLNNVAWRQKDVGRWRKMISIKVLKHQHNQLSFNNQYNVKYFWPIIFQPVYDDVLESDFDSRLRRRRKLEYKSPNRGKRPRTMETVSWAEPRTIEAVTNTVEETTVETVLEDEDIHLGTEEDQDPHHVQYQEDNQER